MCCGETMWWDPIDMQREAEGMLADVAPAVWEFPAQAPDVWESSLWDDPSPVMSDCSTGRLWTIPTSKSLSWTPDSQKPWEIRHDCCCSKPLGSEVICNAMRDNQNNLCYNRSALPWCARALTLSKLSWKNKTKHTPLPPHTEPRSSFTCVITFRTFCRWEKR